MIYASKDKHISEQGPYPATLPQRTWCRHPIRLVAAVLATPTITTGALTDYPDFCNRLNQWGSFHRQRLPQSLKPGR